LEKEGGERINEPGRQHLDGSRKKKSYLHDINDKIWGFAEVGLQGVQVLLFTRRGAWRKPGLR